MARTTVYRDKTRDVSRLTRRGKPYRSRSDASLPSPTINILALVHPIRDMSRPTTPAGEDILPEAMNTEEPTQEVAQAPEEDAPAAKAKRAKAPETIVREPGKSVLPFSRVQKILKVDKVRVVVDAWRRNERG